MTDEASQCRPVRPREGAGTDWVTAPATTGDPLVAPADAVSRATRLTLGATGLAVEALQALLARCMPADPDPDTARAGRPPAPPPVLLLSGAAISLALEAQRRSLRTAAALCAWLRPISAVAVRPAAHGPLAALWRRLDLDGWAARGLAEQQRNQLAAAALLRELVGALAAAQTANGHIPLRSLSR